MYYNNNAEKAVKLSEIIEEVSETATQSMHIEVSEFSNLLCAVNNTAEWKKPL
jgi:hypothetical protein